MLTLIVNGEVYSPEPLGAIDVLVVDDKIAKLGEMDRADDYSSRRETQRGRVDRRVP